MDTQKIRTSTSIMAIGYFLLCVFAFVSLSHIPGLEYAKELNILIYPGFALITAANFIIKNEHRYFKAAFIIFIVLDLFLIVFLVVGKIWKSLGDGDIKESLSVSLKILEAINGALLILGNGLFTNGMKELFASKKKDETYHNMFIFSLVVEFGVTGLILLSTILSLIDYKEGIQTIIGYSFVVAIEFLIESSYCVYTSVITHVLKPEKNNNKKSKE